MRGLRDFTIDDRGQTHERWRSHSERHRYGWKAKRWEQIASG
jgi:hypothetical protein